jgi:hypothetical protein
MLNFFKPNFLKVTDSDVNKIKKDLDNSKITYWDPVGNLPLVRIKENSAKILAQYEKLKNDPNIINKHFRNSIILGFILALFIIPLFIFSLSFDSDSGVGYIVILPFLPYSAVYFYYKMLSRDLLKINVANINNWLYDPIEDRTRYNDLVKYFPEIFEKGNSNSQVIEDQFWGLKSSSYKNHYFYSSLFKYETGSGKSKTTIYNNFFTFALPKTLKCRFHMFPETISFSFFKRKKEIETESIEFNKMFQFSYQGTKDKSALEIVKTLSPALQLKLIELTNLKGKYEILFAHNTITFLFKGFLLKDMKTNFRNSLDLNPQDEAMIDRQINLMIDIFEDMSKYLD